MKMRGFMTSECAHRDLTDGRRSEGGGVRIKTCAAWPYTMTSNNFHHRLPSLADYSKAALATVYWWSWGTGVVHIDGPATDE
jgi:hypothetical protein